MHWEEFWSEDWRTKKPEDWTMQDNAAYELQMICEDHDKQMQEQQTASCQGLSSGVADASGDAPHVAETP